MNNKKWITEGFEAFRRGSFGNGGQNLYVSKNGVLQRIFQYDLTHNGYVDLVFANCQDHYEAAPSYAYTMDGSRTELPGQGAATGMALDIDGDGYMDLVVCGHYDAAAPYASTDIYFGSKEPYSEKHHIRIPTPFTQDCCYGDFSKNGKPQLVFSMPIYKKVRIFTQTDLGLEWNGYKDLPIEGAQLIGACDLDGDGYDDLIVRSDKATLTTVYWGGENGIDLNNKTVLPELPASEILQPEEEKTIQSDMERKFTSPRLLETVKWNGRNCFTLSTGKKMIFFSANTDRQLERVLEIDVKMAVSVSVGDLNGDGLDDIAIASQVRDETDSSIQNSFIIWNSKDGLDRTERTVINTKMACDTAISNGKVVFCQCESDRSYTRDALLYRDGNYTEPQRFESQDSRRCALFTNPDGKEYLFLQNRYARSSIGCDDVYVYTGDKDGYDPKRRITVPGHCAVDALVADFDDDGWAELLVGNNSENSIHLDPGHHLHHFGPDGFEPDKTECIQTDVGWGVCAGDFDHDGYLDILTPANKWRCIRVYRGKDNFKTWYDIELPEKYTSRWPAVADINGDGWLDIVVSSGTFVDRTYILWGGPDGFSMENSTPLAVTDSINATFADLTGNGYLDVIIGSHTDTPRNGLLETAKPHHSFVHIYWNGPEGLSETRKCVLRGDGADSFAIADFNNDGWLDIFVGSYHGGKDRDIMSFLYWNREGMFHELDRQLLYTHSASGCMAADFNEDGYIDLAVANHKVDGDHTGVSYVLWNSADGFTVDRRTELPTCGPHGMISTNMGNIMDRSENEYYISEPYTVTEDGSVTAVTVEGELPPKTSVTAHIRANGGEWMLPENVSVKAGDTLEYRLTLFARNCLRTPRITKVSVEFE